MPALRELQRAVARALLDEEDTGAVLALIADDGIAAAERIAVHRNNLFSALTDTLRAGFPAVCRLVDERFFAYAAHEFIRAFPPRRAVLAEYGEGFAGFLRHFPPCRDLPYLSDVARLEWLMQAAAHAEDRAPIAMSALAGVAADDAPHLALHLHPAFGLMDSPFPIDRIWRANRGENPIDEAIDLAAGGVHLQVDRRAADVMLTALDAASFAFRLALLSGGTLEAAANAALGIDAAFDLTQALAALFTEGAIVGVHRDEGEFNGREKIVLS